MIKHNLSVKVRLYPNDEQIEIFQKTVGCCRFLYNYYLDFRLKEYARYCAWRDVNLGAPSGKFGWSPLPTEASLKEEFDWLREVDSQALIQSRRDLETAYKRFFSGVSQRPRFHKKGQKESFRLPQTIKLERGRVKLSKYGWCRYRGHPSFDVDKSKLKSVTVSRTAGKWYASMLYEVPSDVYYTPSRLGPAIGIDVGVVNPVTIVSDTGKNKVLGKNQRQRITVLESRRKRYQRRYAKKQIGSSNQYKARMKVARAYQKERNYRTNWVEQSSCRLSKFSVIAFEDLRLANMTKSAKGTPEAPGKNVKAKSGLNRELLRLGLGRLMVRTEQKAHRTGAQVIYVPPQNTSRTCSDCGTIDKRSRESQSRFHCVHCGFTLNADVNAAKNILALGKNRLRIEGLARA